MVETQSLTVQEEIFETSSKSIQPTISDGNSSIRLTTMLLNVNNYWLDREQLLLHDNANLYSKNHYFLVRMVEKHMQSIHFSELFTTNVFLGYFDRFWRK
jgi:hypothetical protein